MGTADVPPALASIVGIPFDCGTHEFRIGARQGPDAIREQSRLVRNWRVGTGEAVDNPAAFLGLTDLGNVACTPGDVAQAFPRIEAAIGSVVDQGALPIGLGGDGAVTLPQLRAVARQHRDLAVLHFDAHTDTYDLDGYNTATTFTRAAEEGLFQPNNCFHIGTRGTTFKGGVIPFGQSLGFNIVTFERFHAQQAAYLAQLKQQLGDRPVYLCFDMDVFDPSCAPGVCTPEWGGLTALEGLRLLRSLSGLNFVAFDVNTVSPAHDVGGTTAFLAATVVQEFMALATVTVNQYPARFAALRAAMAQAAAAKELA